MEGKYIYICKCDYVILCFGYIIRKKLQTLQTSKKLVGLSHGFLRWLSVEQKAKPIKIDNSLLLPFKFKLYRCAECFVGRYVFF